MVPGLTRWEWVGDERAIITEMINQASIQNLNGPEKTIFGLFIVSNNDISLENFTI